MKINERVILSGVILLIGFGLGYFAKDLRGQFGKKSAPEVYAPEIGTLFNDDLPSDLEVKVAAYIQALNGRDYKALAALTAAKDETALSIASREREYRNQFRQEDYNTNPWEYFQARLRVHKNPKDKREYESYEIVLRRQTAPQPQETRRIPAGPARVFSPVTRDFDLSASTLTRADNGQWYFDNVSGVY